MQFYFNEIHHLASLSRVSFKHISRTASSMADCLSKQGVDRSCNLSAHVMWGVVFFQYISLILVGALVELLLFCLPFSLIKFTVTNKKRGLNSTREIYWQAFFYRPFCFSLQILTAAFISDLLAFALEINIRKELLFTYILYV